MPQRTDLAQAFCNRCNQPTLHQRLVTETNHVLHLLVTVLCCGLWLPVWILISFVNSLENPPYLCKRCGHSAGDLTPEQYAAMAQQAAIQRQHVAAARAQARVKSGERRAELFDQVGAGLKAGTATTFKELKRLPGRTDRLLQIVAGEGNDIIFWFLRIVTVALVIGLAIAILAGTATLIGRLAWPR